MLLLLNMRDTEREREKERERERGVYSLMGVLTGTRFKG